MSEIKYVEYVAVLESQSDSDGIVTAWDYGIERFTMFDDGQTEEVSLMSGQADDFETAERNIRVKLANLDRPTL